MNILSITTVRNEAPFLLEWIAHHQGAGVTDFLIYSNDCDDGTAQMLDLLDAAGVITHQPHTADPKKSIQWQALRAAWKHPMRKQADWILVSDLDEFINIHVAGHSIPDLINALPESTDAIALPWRLLGNNGHVSQSDTLTTERFTASMPADCSYPLSATFIKTLFRAKGPFNQLGVHRPKQKPVERAGHPNWVDGSGKAMPPEFAQDMARISPFSVTTGRDLVECNHYSVRSAEDFMVKRMRGLPNRKTKAIDLAYWVERNFNSEMNDTIKAMKPATEVHLATLNEIPGVSDLHQQAVAWHLSKFHELMKDDESLRLFGQLLVAGSSQALPLPMRNRLVRMQIQNLT